MVKREMEIPYPKRLVEITQELLSLLQNEATTLSSETAPRHINQIKSTLRDKATEVTSLGFFPRTVALRSLLPYSGHAESYILQVSLFRGGRGLYLCSDGRLDVAKTVRERVENKPIIVPVSSTMRELSNRNKNYPKYASQSLSLLAASLENRLKGLKAN